VYFRAAVISREPVVEWSEAILALAPLWSFSA
jgi:hypothetical protein